MAVVLWAAPLWDAAFGRHNLLHVVAYFGHGSSGIGWARGLGIFSTHLEPAGPWSGGRERADVVDVRAGSLWPLVAVLAALLVLLLWSVHRRRRASASLTSITIASVIAGAVAAGRLEEPVLAYLVVWTLPLAMMVWATLGIVGVDLILDWSRLRRHPPRWGPWVGSITVAAALTAIAVTTAATTSAAINPPLPRQRLAPAATALVGQLTDRYPRGARVRVEAVGDPFHEIGPGLISGLARAGFVPFTTEGADADKWGDRAWTGQRVRTVFTVTYLDGNSLVDPEQTCRQDATLRVVAQWDALRPSDRRVYRTLQLRHFIDGTLRSADQARLDDLRPRAIRLVVFAGDHPCEDPAP